METFIPNLISAILFIALGLMLVTFLLSKQRAVHLQVVYLLRFPIIAAMLLLLLPLVAITSFSRIFGNIFAFESVGAVALVVWIAILVAWTVMYTALLVINNIPDVYRLPDYRPYWREHPVLRWLSKHRVWLYALLALPTIIVIIAKAEIWGNDALGGCSLAGVAVGIMLALLAAAGFYWLLTRLQANPGVQRLLKGLRRFGAYLANLLKLPESARQGFRTPDAADGIRHEIAMLFLLVLGILYLAGIYLFHPKQYQSLIPYPPTAAYFLSLLLILTWLLSGIAHFVDRYRLPTSLLILIVTFVVAYSPATTHYYKLVPMTPTPVTPTPVTPIPVTAANATPTATPVVDAAAIATATEATATEATATEATVTEATVTEAAQLEQLDVSQIDLSQIDLSYPDNLPFPDSIRNAQVENWMQTIDIMTPTVGTPDITVQSSVTTTGQISATGEPPPMVIIMASGGGIQSAVWTARVLTGLQEELGPTFVKAISLVSAVSGGTVGTMYYVDSFTKAGPPPIAHLDEIVAKAGESTVDQAAWGLFYPDLWRTFLGGHYGLGDGFADRSWAMETAWEERLRELATSHNTTIQTPAIEEHQLYANRPVTETHVPTNTRLLSDWQAGVTAGWRPAVIFNATEAETGERFLFATSKIPLTWTTRSFYNAFPGYDIGVATAARMASTFPYASPLARAKLTDADLKIIAVNLGYTETITTPTDSGVTTSMFTDTEKVENWNLADGGYFDNDGVFTGLQWLQMILESQTVAQRPRRIVIIQTLNSQRATEVERCDSELALQGAQATTVYSPTNQLTDPPTISVRGSWLNEVFGPVLTLLSSWDTSQVQRGQTEIDTFIDLVEHQYDDIHVLYCVFDLRESDVLSWHLSPSEFANVTEAWSIDGKLREARIEPRVIEIAKFLGIPYAGK